jgi:Family of unknown function (DUF6062)
MRHASSRETPTADIHHALGRPGCAVCHLTHRSVTRFLRALSYEQVNDVGLRAELRAARGFCQVHAQRWLGMSGNVLGTAIIYRDVITAAVRSLGSAPERSSLRGLLGGRSSREASCVACTFEADAQDRFVDAVLGASGDPDVLRHSDGLCLPHTKRAVERDARRAEPLVALARKHAEQIMAELDEVIRKEDYRFKHEPRTDAERTVPRRAVAWTTGLDL